jgi:hypothetical protein
MTGFNGQLVKDIGNLGICGATILSAGTVVNNFGGTIECTVSDNSYAVSFPGFRQTPLVFFSNHDANSSVLIPTSKSTSTCLIKPLTFLATGGTGTNAEFDILVMGIASL